MKDEPQQKNKMFADPSLNMRIGKDTNDNLVPGADETPGGDEAQSAIADGDDVVAPYRPSPDAISGGKVVAPNMPSSSLSEQTRGQKSSHLKGSFLESVAKSFLQNPRSNFFRLALVITVATVACLCAQRWLDQASLDHHSELAQVNEYGKRPHAAALEWTEAIAAAKRMQLPPKVIADLDMRAQRAWFSAFEEICMDQYKKKISDTTANEIFHDIDVHRRAELREAVALYSRIENCQASEIRALWALEQKLDVSEWYQPVMDKPAPLNCARANAHSENELLNDYCQKNPELSELVKGSMNPTHAISKLAQMQLTDKEAQTLIPVMHEHVFTSSGREPFLQAEQQLDRVLQEAGYNPLSFEDRLKLAKNAVADNDEAGAVVEYIRCLGLKQDDQTRGEFLQLCGGMLKKLKDYDQSVRDQEEALIVLDKLHTLESKCFGAHSRQTVITLMARARVLRSAGRFDEAEKTLDDLLTPADLLTHDDLLTLEQSVPTIQAEKGVLLAAAGRFDQAAKFLHQALRTNNERGHMLETLANIESATGHFSQAWQSLDEEKSPGTMPTPDTFGILKPDQFDSTTVQ